MKSSKLYLFAAIVIIISCNQPASHNLDAAKDAVNQAQAVDTASGSCAYLTEDETGRPLLSWVKKLSDTSAVFTYAVSADSGRTFSQPVTIPVSNNIYAHAENLPKIIAKKHGEMLAIWGASNPLPINKYAGLIFYSQSFDSGRTWTSRKPLVDEKDANDQRYFDVKKLPNGEVGILWLDARKTEMKKGSALYYATTSGKSGFGKGKLITMSCCECCRTALAIDDSGSMNVLYRAIIDDSIRDMKYLKLQADPDKPALSFPISNDRWVINTCPHSGPAMTASGNTIHVAWYTGGRQRGIFYSSKKNNLNVFAPPQLVSALGHHPQIVSTEKGNVVCAWEEPVVAHGAMYNRIAVELRNPEGLLIAKQLVTDTGINAIYPVLQPLRDNTVLLAYTIERDGKSHVVYQKIDLDKIQGDGIYKANDVQQSLLENNKMITVSNMHDPVCGMDLHGTAHDTLMENGKIIGFCSVQCKNRFTSGTK